MIGQDKNISFYFPAEGNIEASFSWVSVKKKRFPFLGWTDENGNKPLAPPYLPPKILHKHCFQFLLGRL